MDAFSTCCSLLPHEFRQDVMKWPMAEELRLRTNYPPTVLICGGEHIFSDKIVNEDVLKYVVEVATGASMQSAALSINSGYINFKGLRIGLCGRAVFRNNELLGFRKYNSISIRIPKQCYGSVPDAICKNLFKKRENTLIIGPPGSGKTTALRELVRTLSGWGMRISLVDERGELNGDGSFDLGRYTDIISELPKADGAMFLLRSMNPELIAMDEITKEKDVEAIQNIAGCGVNIFATAHGKDLKDMLKRPIYRHLFESGVFENIIKISMSNEMRRYELERISL